MHTSGRICAICGGRCSRYQHTESNQANDAAIYSDAGGAYVSDIHSGIKYVVAGVVWIVMSWNNSLKIRFSMVNIIVKSVKQFC